MFPAWTFIQRFFEPTIRWDDDDSLLDYILELEDRIEILEEDNLNFRSSIYDMENRLETKISQIHPVTYNIQRKTDNV